MRYLCSVSLSLAMLCGLVANATNAQTAPLAENQKAVVVFDLRLDLLRESELAKTLGLEDQLAQMAADDDDSPDPNSVLRVFGALSAPENLQTAQGFGMGEIPIEFFVKVKMVDQAATDKFMEKVESKSGETIERNGKTYYRPPSEENGKKVPENLFLHRVDETTLEFGTEAYVFHPDQNVFTAGLKEAWSKVPDNRAIRIALDIEGASQLLAEAVEMGKQGGNPMVAGYLDLVDNMKNLRLAIDISSENLLTLQSTAIDSENAEELRGGIDALLGMGKMALGAQIPRIKESDAEAGAVLESFVQSLEATSEGDEVSVEIPKPEGFDAAVQKAVQQTMPMPVP